MRGGPGWAELRGEAAARGVRGGGQRRAKGQVRRVPDSAPPRLQVVDGFDNLKERMKMQDDQANKLEGHLKHIDGISDEEITGLEIPTGIPLVYHLDKDLKPIKSPRATVPVLSGYFLADQSDLEAAQKKVADQTQVADG